MKVLFAFLTVLLSIATAQVSQNICKPTEVVFLLDQSENARKASTYEGSGLPVQLLKNAWDRFMNELQSATGGNDRLKIWAWSYSSRATPLELVSRFTPPSQAHNPAIGTIKSGGSWTYKGLEQLQNSAPNQPNNIVIIISAQGSNNANRLALAQGVYRQLRQNGWNTYVIGVKASSEIDTAELEAVNSQPSLVVLDDGKSSNKKSYTLLGQALTDIKNRIICPPTTITTTTTTTTTRRPPLPPQIVTMPPVGGICTNCKVEGGYGFDSHRDLCDLFYRCLPDGSHVLQQCGQKLIWDNSIGTCVRANEYNCQAGLCDAGRIGNRYESGTCCNMYFECTDDGLAAQQCKSTDEVYDAQQQRCVRVSDPLGYCRSKNSNLCNVRADTKVKDCGYYSQVDNGDVCQYMFYGTAMNVSPGTAWNQEKCSLVASSECDLGKKGPFGDRGLSTDCSAIVMSSFNDGRPDAESQRNPDVDLHVQFTNADRQRGSLLLRPDNGVTSSAYYFFFNNNEISMDSAFRLVFRLSNNANQGLEYDLFTNNFCLTCPQTIGATVRKVSLTSYEITTQFTESETGGVVRTVTRVDNVLPGNWIDMVVVWGMSDVHGVIKTLSNSKSVVDKVNINSTPHTPNAKVEANKCGILLGAGPNSNFVGEMDEFAFYSQCSNIDDVFTFGTVP